MTQGKNLLNSHGMDMLRSALFSAILFFGTLFFQSPELLGEASPLTLSEETVCIALVPDSAIAAKIKPSIDFLIKLDKEIDPFDAYLPLITLKGLSDAEIVALEKILDKLTKEMPAFTIKGPSVGGSMFYLKGKKVLMDSRFSPSRESLETLVDYIGTQLGNFTFKASIRTTLVVAYYGGNKTTELNTLLYSINQQAKVNGDDIMPLGAYNLAILSMDNEGTRRPKLLRHFYFEAGTEKAFME